MYLKNTTFTKNRSSYDIWEGYEFWQLHKGGTEEEMAVSIKSALYSLLHQTCEHINYL